MVIARRISQIFFLCFFVLLFIQARFPYGPYSDSDLLLRFSPLLPVFALITELDLSLLYLPAVIIIIATIFFGRFFCGWICPLGTTIDLSGKILKSPANAKNNRYNNLKYLKYAILLSVILLATFSVNLWSYLDPLAIFYRVITATIYPVFTFFSENLLLGLTNISLIEDAVYVVYDGFKNLIMPEEQIILQQIFWISLLFILIIGLEKISRRFWCRNICPAGALLALLSQFRFYERIVSTQCPGCNKCLNDCKMNAIPDHDISLTDKTECIECFNCGSLCPPKSKSITFRWRWLPYHSPVDFNRRQFLQTSAFSLLSIGLLSVGLKNRNHEKWNIRPPGAVPEDLFVDRCIRCLACVRICSSNGRCLQPDGIHASLLELWTPVAVMREGYCEYNCNLCGQVCPTEAILPLELATKQQTAMGMAYFDKNICIPYADHKDCIVCEEHCPTPDKAIKFDIRQTLLPDGSQILIKYPYVRKDLCIGCGICETKCPLSGNPGIYVTTDNQKRISALPEL
jgi:polyferredoxin